jgi:hypothetical protein
MEASLLTWCGATVLLLLCLVKFRPMCKGFKPLPGPRQLPLLGNTLQMPKSHEWIKYAQWGKKYGLKYPLCISFPSNLSDVTGAVVQVRLFGQSVVIINSHKAAVELLEKKSAMYSDRPRLVMAGEL